MEAGRYSRQEVFYPIGIDGQKKICEGRVCIIGMGALGSAISNNLVRAGVGYLRLVDRDITELSNLQRQVLYTERDVEEQIPKAEAARIHLSKVNSEIEIEPRVVDVNPYNIEEIISDVDIVVDGTDNLKIRYLINEACHKHGIPWIYGGVAASGGMVMNILPGEGPCLECLLGNFPGDGGEEDTCDTVGVISPITTTIAAYETAETLKFLTGSDAILRQVVSMDLWDNYVDFLDIEKNPDCPVCARGEYRNLEQRKKTYTTSLCGHDAYQITPGDTAGFNYDKVAEALRSKGKTEKKKFYTTFENDETEFKLFPDGRTLISGVISEEEAGRIYSKYVGID